MKYWIFPLMAAAAMLCGCPKKQAMQEPAKEPLTETAPATHRDGSAQVPFPEQPAANQAPQPEMPPAPAVPPARPMSGWRVQLFASGTRENARKVAEEARWKLPEHQLFIIEQDGLHKVQAGNGLSRTQADQLKQRAKELGFSGAFAIEFFPGR